jgi:excisionase family DNA binding protein
MAAAERSLAQVDADNSTHQQEDAMPKLLLAMPEVCQATGLRPRKVQELVSTGELESVKIGRRRLIPVDALEDFIAKLRAKAD